MNDFLEKTRLNILLIAGSMKTHSLNLVDLVKDPVSTICLEAVRNDGLVIRHIIDPTPEMCLIAVKENRVLFNI